ncbi:MAG: Rne/Rng family ribonuclease [Acidimicrobiia bacterium]|nr:Rne/Rng family ribonuclease [Acidimicrobiia bacterium]
MPKELIVSVTPQETKAAILENDQVIEIHFERDKEHGVVGAICKGRVMKVLPGMQSAFVDIGLERDAFLYVSDFFEDADEYDKLASTAEEQVEKLAHPAGAASVQASPAPPAAPDLPVATPAFGKFQDRQGRSRRARRFRLKGKHYEGAMPAQLAPSPTMPLSPKPEDGAGPAAPVDGDSPAALSPLPGESLANYPASLLIGTLDPEAEMLSEASDEVENASDDEAEEMGRSATEASQPSSDADEEENVAEVLAAAELLSGSFLDTEPGETDSMTVIPSEEAPSPDAVVPDRALSDSDTAGARLGAAAATDSLTPEVESSPQAAFIGTLATPLPAESPTTFSEPAEAATGEAHPATPERPDTTASDPAAGEPAGQASAAAANASGMEKAQIRSAPGTPKFFRRGNDRRRRPGSFESREESASSPSAPLIADLLKEGQEILVQIAKEPLGSKGARITSHIALPGRYLVYMPTVDHIGVSRKIESDEERQWLKRIIQGNRRSNFPGGFIVRTAGQGRGEEEFKADIKYLYALWAEIKMRADKKKSATIVHRDLNLVQRILRDQLSAEFSCIRVDNELEYAAIVEFINRFQPSLVSRVRLYTKETPIFEEFGIQSEIDKALRNKVWLKSGGHIVIDQAEALVAIDVNTGKYVGKSNKLEDTIVKTNIEAAKEIARQVRLRDLGGIIVCDFIDMEDRKNRLKVTQTLEEALRSDKSPSKILQFNDFGLVAITRKRVKQSLMRALCEPCSQCGGSGMTKSSQTVCYEIQGEMKKMAKSLEGKEITVRASPAVAKALKGPERSVIEDMETLLKRDIIIKTDPLLHPERFDIYS